jgi:hypothetical protein
MVFTIFLALAGILIFAIWSNNDFYLYAEQSYSRSIAAPSKLTSSTENPGNTITTANTSISQQQQTGRTWSSSSVPSIQSQQSSPSNPITTDDGFSAGLRDGETRGFIDAKKGIDNNQCGLEHSNSYCAGYKIGYRLTLRPYL